MARFIRAKSSNTLSERQRVGRISSGYMDPRKEVKLAKGESLANAHCSLGCKSHGDA